jgi:hypothetical protein
LVDAFCVGCIRKEEKPPFSLGLAFEPSHLSFPFLNGLSIVSFPQDETERWKIKLRLRDLLHGLERMLLI